MEMFGKIADEQQGFRADRSCLISGNGTGHINGQGKGRMEEGKPFHVAYLDISKAYDTVRP